MEFLVHIVHMDVRPLSDREGVDLARLTVQEHQRVNDLALAGTIRRLWRIPGQRATWGIWRAPDATALHQALASLPFYAWLSIDVVALADHPSDPGDRDADR